MEAERERITHELKKTEIESQMVIFVLLNNCITLIKDVFGQIVRT